MNNIPSSWDEVYLDQYVAIQNINSNSSFFERQIEILSILTDTLPDDERWEDMDFLEVNNIIKNLHWLKMEPSKSFKKEIDNKRYIGLNILSFGEWLDLEHLFGENYLDNLPTICSILYRRYETNKWNKIEYIPYDLIDYEEDSKAFKDIKINDIYGIISEYLSFKETITKTYENIFEPNFEKETQEEIDNFNEEEKQMYDAEQTNLKWGWERVLYNLANQDITKIEEITRLPLIFVLNNISMKKSLNL